MLTEQNTMVTELKLNALADVLQLDLRVKCVDQHDNKSRFDSDMTE